MFQGSGFGSTSTTTPFGSFAKPATTGFVAAPVFGSTSTSLFGQTTQPASGGLFGSTTAAPAFGQAQTTQPSFGGFSSGTGSTGLFGSQQNATTSGTGLFGSGATSAFGQTKPAFGGFSTQTAGGGLFGQQAATQQPQPQSTSIFGQSAATPGNTSIFGSTGFGSTLGGTANTGTGAVKFTAVTGTDTMVKGGVSQTISTRHHCITCMKEYEGKSLEELRLEDYAANRKGPQQATAGLFGGSAQPSLFGGGANTSTTTTSLFGGDSKPLFGGTNTMGFSGTSNVFGSPSGSLFGKPAGAPVTFGAATTTAGSTFGFNTSSTSNPFGSSTAQVKPFGSTPQTSLFGTTTTQPTAGFGTQSSGFGSFGAQPTQNIGLFNQNKSFNVGTSGTGFSFGQTPATTTPASNMSLFGSKPTGTFGSSFGTPATGTGTSFGSFGSPNQNTLFSSGFKPATTGFSFGQTPTTSSSLGTGSTLGGSSFFGNTANKSTGLFGGTSTGTGLFGSSGFGSTGTTTFGTGTGTSLGTSLSLGSNPLMGGSTFSSTGQNQASMNPLNQHILALASLPFGDTPLFKNLLPTTGKVDELLKPTGSAAQKTVLNGQNYKVSSQSNNRIKVRPLGATALTKKSLFEGLEDEVPEGSQVSRLNPRRLVLKPKRQDDDLNVDATAASPVPSKTQPVDNADSQLQISAPKYFNSKVMQDATQQFNETEASNPLSTPDSTQNDTSKSSVPATTHATDRSTNTVTMISLATGPENTMSELGNHHLSTSMQSASENKENIEQHSSSSTSSDSENSDMALVEETHPTGIVLRRVGYYTIPPMDELSLLVENGQCIVENFTIGRYNYGNVFFPESFDVYGLNLDEIVHIRHKEVVLYPDDDVKPPVGQGLNRPAQVTLDRVWPIDKITRLPVDDEERLAKMDYEGTLRRACAKNNTRFKEYRSQTGSWVFKVDHFSKYGLSDSDEEEPPVSEVKKLKFTTADQTGIPAHTSKELQQSLKQQGLDRAWTTLNGQTPPANMLVMEEDDQEMEDSLIKTPFDLDDDYQPTQKSPSMHLAQELGASSHKVQIMKATFYHDEQDDFNMVDGDYIDFRAGNIPDVEELEQGPKLNKSFHILRTQFAKKQLAATTTPPASLAIKVGTDVGELIPAMPSLGPTVPPPPPVHPQTVSLHHPGGVVCYTDSTIKRVNARCLADCALMKGRSFRVGWGKDCTLVSLTTQTVAAVTPLKAPLDELGNMLIGRIQPDTSPSIVQRIRILGGQMDDMCPDFQASIEEHLEIALEHSIQDGGIDRCPVFAPKSGVDNLHAHCSLAQRLAQSEINPLFTVSCHVWELCVALWGNLVDLPQHEPPESHKSMMERRHAVSDWLMNVVAASVKQDLTVKDSVANVFTLLTGHCIQEACQQAQSAGDHYAALLLSQLSGSRSVWSLMEQQLMQWKDAQADVLIETERLKLMMLCAGIPVFQATDSVINVCEDLDWKRAFAIHFWYVCSPVASITDALLKYEAAFSSSENYACIPNPSYSTDVNLEWESSSGKPLYDVCYHLLKLYSTRSYPLEGLLNPATHTADPLDYRLSWLLLRTLEALGYTHISEFSSAHIHTSFASQLEAHGLWHWAIFVLLHITNPVRREAAVLDVIGRHVDMNENSEEEQFLVDKLKIPVKWIFQAKAVYASAHNKYKEAAVFLIKAEQWNESHSVIMQHIAPRAIINGKYDYLASLLKEFIVEGRSKEISGWSHQGALLWDYLNVVQQVQSVVAKRDPSVGYHLEKLQPELSRLCARINLLPSSTSIHRLCQAEIAKRTAHLVRTVLILQKGGDEKTIGTSIRVLAHLVNQLPLPEDYTKQELQEIIATMVNNFGWQ